MLNIWSVKSGYSLSDIKIKSITKGVVTTIETEGPHGLVLRTPDEPIRYLTIINATGVPEINGVWAPVDIPSTTTFTINLDTSTVTADYDNLSGLFITEERRITKVALPTHGDLTGVTFSLISGTLPKGLRLEDNFIVGTIFEVASYVISKFVIRASKTTNGVTEISDRTFTFRVEGPDAPTWVTNEGLLRVNPTGQAFVLDNTYIDFQLQAIDRDLPAGDTLEFYIADGDGELPPGLSLTIDGKITGIISPIIALDIAAGNGFFDTNMFDSNAFDFGNRPSTGFETFLYDTITFDYSSVERPQRKLNRNYEFIVSATDGENTIKRTFRIYVVGDDFLRADNTIMKVGDGTFIASATYLRAPYWLTKSNLGIRRASNYITVFLDTFDPNPTVGPVAYELKSINDDGSPSKLPPGVFLDSTNGELFGYIPYQPAVTTNYKFTVAAIKYDNQNLTRAEVSVRIFENAVIGQNYVKVYPLPPGDENYLVLDQLRLGNYSYIVNSFETVDPDTGVPYVGFAILRLDSLLLSNIPANYVTTKDVLISTLAFSTIASARTFELTVLGEVDSVIEWISPLNLGTIQANFNSLLEIRARTSVPNATLSYSIFGQGSLPAGLSLLSTGDIVGKVTQYGAKILYRGMWNSNSRSYNLDDVVRYGSSGGSPVYYKAIEAHVSSTNFDLNKWELYDLANAAKGLTIFDQDAFSLDGRATSIDRQFKFNVIASDQFRYSAIAGTFTLSVEARDPKSYSNITVKPLQKLEKRQGFYSFITDTKIFPIDKIYRLGDPQFGIQTELKMLLYAGIETLETSEYVSSLTKNTRRKRFTIGSPKKAIAKLSGSNDIVYEVIYLEVIDDNENNGKSAPRKISSGIATSAKIPVNQSKFDRTKGNLSSASNLALMNEPLPEKFRPERNPLTADLNTVKVSGSDLTEYYPSSVANMRKNLAEVGATENAYLPLWMLTPQSKTTPATGFIKAIPLCYCKPGEGDFILQNIANSGYDFTQIDYEIDRFTIDATAGLSQEQYLKFPNYKFNV